MSVAIGIDIGTSNFTAVYLLGVDELLIQQFSITIPSMITYHSATHQLVGDEAKNYSHCNCRNTIHSMKMILGKKYSDQATQELKRRCQFIIDCEYDDKAVVVVHRPGYTMQLEPEFIQSTIISHLKNLVEQNLKQKVDSAVVAVPAHFDNNQMQAIIDACKLANLKVLKFISEPTAACMGLGSFPVTESENHLLIFDLGFTIKITIMVLENERVFKIKATTYDQFFGGKDFNNEISNYLFNNIRTHHNKHFTLDLFDAVQTEEAIENAKILLSYVEEVPLEINDRDRKYVTQLKRRTFETLCSAPLTRICYYLDKTFETALINKQCIKKIVVTGGGCKMPMIKQMLNNYFKHLDISETCDTAVATGAALQAAILVKRMSGGLHERPPHESLTSIK